MVSWTGSGETSGGGGGGLHWTWCLTPGCNTGSLLDDMQWTWIYVFWQIIVAHSAWKARVAWGDSESRQRLSQTRKMMQNDRLISMCDDFAFMQINDNVTATDCKYRDCIKSLADIDDSLVTTVLMTHRECGNIDTKFGQQEKRKMERHPGP